MWCSGVYVHDLKEDGIIIGVTDYSVDAFGGSDWEWQCILDYQNGKKLVEILKTEFKEDLSLKEMVINKFGNNLNTVSFVKYLDENGIKYTVERYS